VRLLLDTHVFLWWIGDDSRLSLSARDAISVAENEVFLSVVSAWEISVKTRLGKLALPSDVEQFLSDQIQRNAMTILPIGLAHALRVARLPLHHRDPFDRMLVAQAQSEKLTLVTADEAIRPYDVTLLIT
jgi:PIN domain nuclease of toxin-antitoxin system